MKNHFKEKGYVIASDGIKHNIHAEIFFMFYDLAISCIARNNIKTNFSIKKIDEVNYPKDLKELDKLLLTILHLDNKLIGELYDTISYSSTFLKLISDSFMEDKAREFLDLKKNNTIYSWNHRIRIDPPRDDRRTYGWHQEIFYTFPDTKFLQTWAPIMRDTTLENGTIEICVGSYKEGIAKQTWNDTGGRVTQIIVDENIINKYEQKPILMKTGDVMFFDPHTFHKSGKNSTKDEIRFSLVGMWNDTTYKNFRAPKPEFNSRTISKKENFNKRI